MARSRARIGTAREVAYGTLAVAGLLTVGTLGYMTLEGWPPIDALYMTFITLSTIGFSEVQPLDGPGKLFTMGLAFVGIGTFATIATRAVTALVTSNTLRQRAMQRRIDRLHDHYVVAGYGRLGQRIVRDLVAGGRRVVVVERRDDRVAQLDDEGRAYVQGDAVEEDALREAGLDRAAGLVLVLPEDAANVFGALTAREIAGPDLFIVARTNEESSINKLVRAGADKVISPLEIGADRIAQTILRPRVDQFMEQVLGVDALSVDLEEVVVREGGLLDGRSLVDVDFRRRFNAIVVAVHRAGGGEWRFNPDARLPLGVGDTLVVLASPDQVEHIRSQEGAPA